MLNPRIRYLYVVLGVTPASGNEVVAFDRSEDGTLSFQASYPTGGDGTGAGLGSQGAVLLTPDERYLLAVNAGSDSITVFRVLEGSLERLGIHATGGRKPVSVTVHSNLVYVLHAGGDVGARDSVSGIALFDDGRLSRIPGSARPLSARVTMPAQVSFVQEGKVLVVTEKATNRIDTFVLRPNGQLVGPIVHPSAGATPFGFAEGERDQIIVSEAANGTVSTYRIGRAGELAVLEGTVPTTEAAACWVALPPGARFGYTANTGSDSTTGFSVGFSGDLTILDADGVTGQTGDVPIDAAFSNDGQFLYVLATGDGVISAFDQNPTDGSLSDLGDFGDLPAGVVGLAAR